MRPIEKLREEISAWQKLDQEARETLAITESILPPLLERLAELESEPGSQRSARRDDREAKPSPESAAPPESTSDGHEPEDSAPVFRGDSVAQVEQALRWKSPQCSQDLERMLAAHGRAFSRGAIGYALRDLTKTGRIREVEKRGNLKFFEPVTDEHENGGDGQPKPPLATEEEEVP